MRRIVVLLLLAASLWFGLPWVKGWFRRTKPEAPSPGSSLAASLQGGAEHGASEPPPEAALVGKPVQGSTPAQGEGETVDKLLAGIAARDAAGCTSAWGLLAAKPGTDGERQIRDRVANALGKAVGETKGAADLLAVLGTNNAFLHSDEGRKVAFEVARRAGLAGPTEESALQLTRLVEGCMRGPIEKSQAEARSAVDTIYAALKTAAQGTALNPSYLAHARQHTVAKGQVLEAIARKYTKEAGVPLESWTLALVNRIQDPRGLRAGTVIKIPVETVHTVVEKRSYLMAVYLGDVIVRLYWISHGKDNCTPETTFTIGDKQEKPDWYDSEKGKQIPYGHSDNPLGDFFVRFNHDSHRGFGAHGTIEPESIGTMASRGCVRMRDEDVREFFRIIPRGSKVEVRASA